MATASNEGGSVVIDVFDEGDHENDTLSFEVFDKSLVLKSNNLVEYVVIASETDSDGNETTEFLDKSTEPKYLHINILPAKNGTKKEIFLIINKPKQTNENNTRRLQENQAFQIKAEYIPPIEMEYENPQGENVDLFIPPTTNSPTTDNSNNETEETLADNQNTGEVTPPSSNDTNNNNQANESKGSSVVHILMYLFGGLLAFILLLGIILIIFYCIKKKTSNKKEMARNISR